MDVPVFVVSSSVPQAWVYQGSPFRFVTDGLKSTLQQARTVAGDKHVGVGAASIVQQCLRLFDHLGAGPIDLERTRVIGGAGVTHFTFRVVK